MRSTLPGSIRLCAVLSLFVLSLVVGGCERLTGSPSDPPLRPTRGVVLISIDTLRADHLGAYGYARDTSPFLDELAGRGVLFENAVTHIPSTLPAHVSMLTGLHPKEHRVYPPDGVIPDSIETLAETFLDNGFRTAGFTDGGFLSGSFGFERGFEEYVDAVESEPKNRWVETVFARGLDFLRSLGPEEPFFLFLHTYSVHDPYDPPEPYRDRYWSDPAPAGVFEPIGPNLSRFNCGHLTLDPAERDYLVALYDGGIRYTDAVIGAFFRELDEQGLSDDVTVVITSDHGEEFLEHGLLGHAQVFHHNLHVPLIVLHPDAQPARVKELVRLVDITPTVRDVAALETESTTSGSSLRSLMERREGEARDESEPATAPRSSYAQASVGRGQAIHIASEAQGKIHQYVRKPLGDSWITLRKLVYYSSEPRSVLRARAFLEPRVLRVSIDGGPAQAFPIESVQDADGTPTPPQQVEIPLPQDGRAHRIELSADSCTPARAIGLDADCRCLAIRVGGLPASRESLYEVVADPLEQRDLRMESPASLEPFSAGLDETNRGFEAVAESEKIELDPKVTERLKALGYL